MLFLLPFLDLRILPDLHLVRLRLPLTAAAA
jgi:hypothetical protein